MYHRSLIVRLSRSTGIMSAAEKKKASESTLNDNWRRHVASGLFKSVIDALLRRLDCRSCSLLAHRNHCRWLSTSSEKRFHGAVERIIATRRQERRCTRIVLAPRENLWKKIFMNITRKPCISSGWGGILILRLSSLSLSVPYDHKLFYFYRFLILLFMQFLSLFVIIFFI